MLARSIITAIGFIVFIAVPVNAQGEAPASPPRIRGLPVEALERIPGAARLFEVHNASESPRILDADLIPGELLVRFPLELSDIEIDRLVWLSGGSRARRVSPLGLFVVEGPQTRAATEALMESLWETNAPVTIDAKYSGGGIAFVPNDPHHTSGNQWYHEATSDIDLDMTSAWDITRGTSDVVVAVVDTGVNGHPEFSGRRYVNQGEIPDNDDDDDDNGYVDDVSGWNSIGLGSNDVSDVTLGHGTWVASILLANTNSHQIAGIDHFAQFLPVKALDGQSGDPFDLAAALDYLIANPGVASVVNLSLANYPEISALNAALSALASDAILIGGAGNNGESGPGDADDGFPESHPEVITIAATDQLDARALFSDTGNSVEFAAPGVDIYTASWSEPINSGAAHVGDGTSFATPMVAGIASLGLSIRPGMTRSDLLYVLEATVVDLGSPGWDTEYGWGRVNANDALVLLDTLIFVDGFETGDTTAWSSSFP